MGFQPTFPMFELSKIFHVLDCAAAVIDIEIFGRKNVKVFYENGQVLSIEQGEARRRKYSIRGLSLAVVKFTTV
jgi:hypothetical protein